MEDVAAVQANADDTLTRAIAVKNAFRLSSRLRVESKRMLLNKAVKKILTE